MSKYLFKSGYLLSLLLLLSCVAPGTGTGNQPTLRPSSSPLAEPEAIPPNRRLTLTWKHQGLNLTPVKQPEIEALPRLARLSNGDTLAVGKHKQRLTVSATQESHLLSFVRLDAAGTVRWNKVYALNRLFNLGNVMTHGNHVYVVGTYYPALTSAPDYRNPIPSDSPVHVGLLQFNESGELVSKRTFPLRKGPAGNVYKPSFVVALDARQLAISAHGEIFLLSETKDTAHALVLNAQTLLKTSQGEYLGAVLNRDHVELIKLNTAFEPVWKKSMGASLRGINALSDLHSGQKGLYFLAYSINDLTNQNSYGQVALFFDEAGTVQKTFAHNALTPGSLTIFAEIHGSYQTADSIYLSATHNTGGLGQQSGASITSVYAGDGSRVAVTAIPAFDQGKINLSSSAWTLADLNNLATRLSDQFSFELLQGQTDLNPKGTRLQQNNQYQDPLVHEMTVPDLQPLRLSIQPADMLELQLLSSEFEVQSAEQL